MNDNSRKSQQIKYHCGTLTYTTAGLISLFAWLLWGDFAWAMKDRAIVPAATLIARSFNITNMQYSLIIVAFPNFTNIFLCPIISYISDRHRSRLGRRIPFLLFTTPFIVIGAIGLGFSPLLGKYLCQLLGGTESIALNHAQLLCFSLFWILMDFGTTLSSALSGALINDVVPSELLGRFLGLFRGISLLAGMIFNFWVLGEVENHYEFIFTCVGLLYGIGLLSLCLKVKEGKYPPPSVDGGSSSKHAIRIFKPILIYFRQTFSLSYYRWVIATMGFGMLASAPFNLFAVMYAKSPEIDIPMDRYGLICTITFGFSFIASYFLGMLSDRYHPLRTGLVALGIYFLIMIISFLSVNDARSFGFALLMHNILSGAYFTLVASLGQRLFPQSLFAQFYSAFSMILAIMSVFFGLLIGGLLEWVGGDYRYVFLFGGIITIIAVICNYHVICEFRRLGGDRNYRAPEPNK